jgi:hypothetical protein
MKQRRKRNLILVADGARARFFTLDEENAGLTPALDLDLAGPEAQTRSRELGSDKPGRGFPSALTRARHAFAPHYV